MLFIIFRIGYFGKFPIGRWARPFLGIHSLVFAKQKLLRPSSHFLWDIHIHAFYFFIRKYLVFYSALSSPPPLIHPSPHSGPALWGFCFCFALRLGGVVLPFRRYLITDTLSGPPKKRGGGSPGGAKTSCRRRRRRRPQHEVLDSSSSLRTLERTFPRRRKRKRKRKKRAVLPTRAFLCLFRKNWHFSTWNIFLC